LLPNILKLPSVVEVTGLVSLLELDMGVVFFTVELTVAEIMFVKYLN